jgi:hypothetical protein
MFWHILSAVPALTAKKWVRELVQPVLQAKKEQAKQNSKKGWFGGYFSRNNDDEDNLQEFFDIG